MSEYGKGWMTAAERERRRYEAASYGAMLASQARNAPASFSRTSSDAALDAAAMYLSAQIARLLGLPLIPADEIRAEFAKRPQTFRGIAFPGEGQVFLNRQASPVDSSTLAHELTHIYLGRAPVVEAQRLFTFPGEDSRWIHEGLAHYVKDVLGLGRADDEPPIIGDPEMGYAPASRFFLWMESHWPGSVAHLAQTLAKGLPWDDPASFTGVPASWGDLRDLYEQNPLDPDAEGEMARFLRPQTQDPMREKTMMREHQEATSDLQNPGTRARAVGQIRAAAQVRRVVGSLVAGALRQAAAAVETSPPRLGTTTPSEVRRPPSRPGTLTLGEISVMPDEPDEPPSPKRPPREPLPGVAKSQ